MNETQARELLAQIGRMNHLAISGGRVRVMGDTLILPVGAGYSVQITLDANDTYTVRRVFTRGVKQWVKGERSYVYGDQVGEIAYEASCYVNVNFGAHTVEV